MNALDMHGLSLDYWLRIGSDLRSWRGFTWMPGMRAIPDGSFPDEDGHAYKLEGVMTNPWHCYGVIDLDTAVPDLTHPPTVGAALAMLRRAKSAPFANVQYVRLSDAVGGWFVHGIIRPDGWRMTLCSTEAEAIVFEICGA